MSKNYDISFFIAAKTGWLSSSEIWLEGRETVNFWALSKTLDSKNLLHFSGVSRTLNVAWDSRRFCSASVRDSQIF